MVPRQLTTILRAPALRVLNELQIGLETGGTLVCDSISHQNKSDLNAINEISNNVVCATSKASDQPAHTRSLIRAFASRLSIL